MSLEATLSTIGDLLDTINTPIHYNDLSLSLLLKHPSARNSYREELANARVEALSIYNTLVSLVQKINTIRDHAFSRLCRLSNASSPVAALPPEILEDIFSYVVESSQSSSCAHTISHVCGRWRSIIASQRSLWTYLELNPTWLRKPPEGLLKTCLYRAGDQPLNLELRADAHSPPSSESIFHHLSSTGIASRLQCLRIIDKSQI